ncbi:MAG: hypothetical protein SNJ85_11755 [Cyanobacteriota bacterium]
MNASPLPPSAPNTEPITLVRRGEAPLGSLLQQLSDERFSGRLDIFGTGAPTTGQSAR